MNQYFTPEGIEKLRAELEQLKTVETKKIADLLKYAASFGDLKENAGYDDAKDRQAALVRRIHELEGIVNEAIVHVKQETDGIQIGSQVLIMLGPDKEQMEIVAPSEANILKNKVSYLSPLGAKLMGKVVGQDFDFESGGEKVKVKILEIK